jgi:acetyl esterase/lipase
VITYGGVFGAKEGPIIGDMILQLPSDEQDATYQILMDTPYGSWCEIGGSSESGTEILRLLPLYCVDGSEPPFLLIQGELDILDPAAAKAFSAQLQAVGVDARLVMISDAGHMDIMIDRSAGFHSACKAAEAFLTRVLE